MKHRIDNANVKIELVDISTDVETIIDKLTDSTITIIAVFTASQILKSYLTKGKSCPLCRLTSLARSVGIA